jgi:lipoprotein-releasing system ATP-binding protein
MLEAIDIRKSYKKIEVLKGVSIAVNKSDLVCIVGASGAGKSTLLHIIGTLEKPDNGQLRIMGTDTSLLKGNELAKFRNKHIGFVFQSHNLLPEFTALENICIPGYIQKESKKKVIDKAMGLMELLKISHRKDHKPNELSGGERGHGVPAER